jgi:hypothetical protein
MPSAAVVVNTDARLEIHGEARITILAFLYAARQGVDERGDSQHCSFVG